MPAPRPPDNVRATGHRTQASRDGQHHELTLFGQGESWQYRAGTTAVFITWDEGSGGYPVEDCDDTTAADSSCRVPTIVISPSTPAGATSGTLCK